jgi:hypothetical protein
MTDYYALLATFTAEQRTAFVNAALELNQAAAPAVPATIAATATVVESNYYDMVEAVPVTFKADLSVSPKSRDTTYATTYDHLWCKGSYRVKGPKGGVYFVGRAVLGVKKGQQIKGTLRVGNKHFEAFCEGRPLDAWFRPDGAQESVLIGVLTNFHAV